MADELHNYRIKNNLFKKSVLVGFKEEGIETLGCIEENRHVFISSAIDGGQEESTWGRFLYVMIDAMGSGKGNISKIRVNNRADICMEVLPEIYQEENSFFRRYLSIFSSMYLNSQKKIQGVYWLLDLESAPVELLPTLAHWMGVDVSGEFLEEQRMRTLVKGAYSLNKMKGTRVALERLTEIVLGEKAIILEKMFSEIMLRPVMNRFIKCYMGNVCMM